jgi:hypothetical protein
MTIKNGLWQWSSLNCHDLWLVIWKIQCYESRMTLIKIFIKNKLLNVEHVVIHLPRMVFPTWSTKSHFLPHQSFLPIPRTILSHWQLSNIDIWFVLIFTSQCQCHKHKFISQQCLITYLTFESISFFHKSIIDDITSLIS